MFKLSRELSPSVVFIDEVDSILCARSSGENDAARKMKTEFLVQMDGCGSDGGNVLLIAATNRPDELDDAVLRRMPLRVFVPLPEEKAIVSIIEKKLKNGGVT